MLAQQERTLFLSFFFSIAYSVPTLLFFPYPSPRLSIIINEISCALGSGFCVGKLNGIVFLRKEHWHHLRAWSRDSLGVRMQYFLSWINNLDVRISCFRQESVNTLIQKTLVWKNVWKSVKLSWRTKIVYAHSSSFSIMPGAAREVHPADPREMIPAARKGGVLEM